MHKMNILQYGKNPYFTEEFHALGHKVFRVGESTNCDLQLHSVISAHRLMEICISKGFVPDVFFYADDSTLPHLFFIEELSVPAVFYSIDTYCHVWHGAFSRIFDYVLYAQGEEKHKFSDGAEHFPLFATKFSPFESRKEWFENRSIPVTFVGTLGHKNNPKRTAFFSLYKTFMPIFITKGDFEPVFRRAKIVLNQSAVGELNFRTFEAMALGCACLADNVPTDQNGIASIFRFGIDSLPAYPRDDVAKAVDFSLHWLSEEKQDELYEIAMRGRELVKEKHSARVRACRLNEIFQAVLSNHCVQKRLNALSGCRKYAADAYRLLSEQNVLEQPLHLAYADIQKKYEIL